MKKILFFFFLVPAVLHAQNIYTVSNVSSVSANFRTLQGAHDSVPAGSILYLLPGAGTYGNARFTKKLTVYGTGYFLGNNLEPNTQANTAPVVVNQIIFSPGSDNTFIEGIQLNDLSIPETTTRLVFDSVSNIIISRCLVTPGTPNGYAFACYMYVTSSSNIAIRQTYFQMPPANTNLSGFINMSGATGGVSGMSFSNCIIDDRVFGNNGTNMVIYKPGNVISDISFTNNTFLISLVHSQMGNLNYTNNIFINTADQSQGTQTNSDVQLGGTNMYNISSFTHFFPSLGNNYEGANTDSMFVGTQTGYHSIDGSWMVRPDNLAYTFGSGGTTSCGAYGGNNPYKLSGIPAIPFVYEMTVPQQATAPGTIGVHIKAKATN